MSNIGMNIARARKMAGLTQPGLASLCGWSSQSRVSNYERGLREPKIDDLKRIAKATNTKLDELISHINPVNEVAEPFANYLSLSAEDNKSVRNIVEWNKEEDLPNNDYLFIPRLDIRLSAGNGATVIDGEDLKPQAFRADWFQQIKLNPKDLVCMVAHGQSMEPRISDNDSLLVDLSQRDVKDGKIYAIRIGNDLSVKRLFNKLNGGIRIVSDSSLKEEFPDIEVEPSELEFVEIIGRVVWVGGVV